MIFYQKEIDNLLPRISKPPTSRVKEDGEKNPDKDEEEGGGGEEEGGGGEEEATGGGGGGGAKTGGDPMGVFETS